jgi:hypothetical protein
MKNNQFPYFHYQRLQEASKALVQRLKTQLASSEQERVSKLAADLEEISPGQDKMPITLAFVGQYNAGKSTLIKGLTQNAKITIDADVCTDEVTAYDWGGLRVIDTPGIHAGFPVHDDLTEQQVSRSHLLVFVITGELFGLDMAKYFRDIAFEKGYASKLMLVVNKMDNDPGTADDKRADIERVTTPLKLEEFRTVFVSGEVYLDALAEKDSAAKASLIDESGMPGLMAGLDAFAKDCGLLGSLTAPLFGAKSIAIQAVGICSVDRPEERAAIELLGRRARILRESRFRLSSRVKELLDTALADLSLIGDAAAGQITPAKEEEVIKSEINKAEKNARERVDKLKKEITTAIGTEQATLESELSRLAEGDLATMLRKETGVPAQLETGAEFKGASIGGADSSMADRLRKTGQIAKGVGDWMVRVSQGSKGISGWGKAAAAGSDAHKVIYDLGKLFGYSFKPWEAAGYAAKIAKIGKILGPIAAILQVVGQVLEEKMEDEERAKFQSARTDTRAIFRDGAGAVRQQFLAQFEVFLNDFYGKMQSETDRLAEDMSSARSQRNRESSEFEMVAKDASTLIEEIEGAFEV